MAKLQAEYQLTIQRINQLDGQIQAKKSELAKCKNRLKYFRQKVKGLTAEQLVDDRPMFSILVKRMIGRIDVGDNDITIELL